MIALSAPTGRPARHCTAAERARMRAAFRRLAQDEAALRNAPAADVGAGFSRDALLWWATLALYLVVIAIVAFAPSDLRAEPRGATYPAYVIAYTYDGPVEFVGSLIDFAYAHDGLTLVLGSVGDGIYRNNFEEQ